MNSVTPDRQLLHDYDQILGRLAPAGALLDEGYQVLHYFGAIGPYLKPPAGPVETDFVQLVVDDLRPAVSMGLQRAATGKGAFTLPNVAIRREEEVLRVDVSVDCIPYDKTPALHYLVTFTPVRALAPQPTPAAAQALPAPVDSAQATQARIAELEPNLQATRETLEATVAELRASNAELHATNAQLLAANHELRSANTELHARNTAYAQENADLHARNAEHVSLLASLETGVVFVDARLAIRTFNPASAAAFKLLPQHGGRPLDQLACQLIDQAGMLARLHAVLTTGQATGQEVQTHDGSWLLERIYPYRDDRQAVVGAILTFTDVTALKNEQAQLHTLFELLPVGVAILDRDRQVVNANPQVAAITALSRSALVQGEYRRLHYVRPDGSELPPAELASARALQEGQPVYDVETGIVKEDGTLTWANVSAAPLPDGGIVVITADITQRKQAEQELRRWADIFRHVQWGFVVGEADGKTIAMMNPAFAAMHGRTEQELLGAPILDLFAPEWRAEVPNHIRQAHESGFHTFESVHIRKDGTTFPVLVQVVAVKDERGELLYRIVSVQDITERKQAEAQRAQLAERLALATRAAGIGIWDWDIQQNKLIWDDPMYALYGLQPGEFGGAYEAWLRGVHPDDRAASDEASDRARRGEGEYDAEFRVMWPDETVHWLKANGQVFRDAQGAPLRMVGVNYDITERKRAENAIRESEERFATLFRANPTPAGITRKPNLAIVDVNDAWCRLTGYTRDQAIGHTSLELGLATPETLRQVREFLQTHATARDFDLSLFTQAGEERHILMSAEPISLSGEPCVLSNLLDITERKRAERELKESEERFATAFFTSPVPQSIIDATQSLVLDVNNACCRLFGYTRKELIGTDPDTLNLWADPAQQLAAAEELQQTGRYLPKEISLRLKSGEVRIAIAAIEPIMWQGIPCFISSTIDITDRKQAELALRASEEKYHGLMESLDSMIVSIDAGGAFLYLNEVAARLVGGSATNLTGKTIYEVFPAAYADPIMDTIRQVIRQDRALVLEQQNLVQGRPRWFRAAYQPLHNEQSAVSQVLVNATDIHELKSAQQALAELNRTLEERIRQATAEIQDLYDHAPAGYHSLDANGRIVMINQTELDWLGYTRAELIGQPFARLFTPASLEIFQSIFSIFKQRGWDHDVEVDLVRKDGSTFPVLVRSTAVKDEAGNYVMSRSTVFDNTERKQAEAALRESRDRLDRANRELAHAGRAKDEFLANMSHELRTPLNGILGLAELLLTGWRGPLNEHQRTYVDNIDASGRHLLSLINDILDLSKVEADKLELKIDTVPVTELCRASLIFVKESALKKGVTLDLVLDETLTTLRADARRLKQILVNLLSNAVKFTPAGGKVTLTTRLDRERGCVELAVSDTGIGIAAVDQSRLFAAFTQVDNSMTRAYEGTGLGLTLVKRLTELHGGSVALESAPGQGSRFTVSLPWQEGDAVAEAPIAADNQPAPSAALPDAPPKNKAILLLVEDNATNAMTITEYLDVLGYSIVRASDGYEALEQAVACAPDLVLMDSQMPRMDGLEATRRLRANPQFAATPIIALTARAMKGDRERCLAAGANEYLSKPVNLKELEQLIRRLLDEPYKASGTPV